jgi:hypothetical protein
MYNIFDPCTDENVNAWGNRFRDSIVVSCRGSSAASMRASKKDHREVVQLLKKAGSQ